jgi:hypothetical protein
VFRERFAQCVSVLLVAKLGEHRDYQASAAQFQSQAFKDAIVV